MRQSLLSVAIALFVLPLAPSRAEPAPATLAQCLDARLDAAGLDIQAAVGLSVAIVPVNGAWSWAAARGLADREAGEPLTPAHGFRIASITKTYTAAAILRLAELGKLDLDDPIARHLPEDFSAKLVAGGYDPRAIRIRHLLNHTSGMREHVSEAWLREHGGKTGRVSTPAEQLDGAMAAGPPLAPLGTAFHYSDTGYVLLGGIIERHTGKPLHAALRDLQRWDEHGIDRTWFETLEPARAPQAHQYWEGTSTRGWHPSFDLYGGGGIVASPSETAKFLRVLLAGELFEQPRSLQVMRTPGVPDAWNGYGAGLFELEVDGEKLTGHSGFWNTFVFHSEADGAIFAGAVSEKTAIPYTRVIGTLRTLYRHCAAP